MLSVIISPLLGNAMTCNAILKTKSEHHKIDARSTDRRKKNQMKKRRTLQERPGENKPAKLMIQKSFLPSLIPSFVANRCYGKILLNAAGEIDHDRRTPTKTSLQPSAHGGKKEMVIKSIFFAQQTVSILVSN
jgi:hypothetical protein